MNHLLSTLSRDHLWLTLCVDAQGINPVEVEVMTPQDAIVEVEPGKHMGEVAQALHGIHEWEGQAVEISCLLSTHRLVLNIVCECEAGCTWLFQLEEAQQ